MRIDAQRNGCVVYEVIAAVSVLAIVFCKRNLIAVFEGRKDDTAEGAGVARSAKGTYAQVVLIEIEGGGYSGAFSAQHHIQVLNDQQPIYVNVRI